MDSLVVAVQLPMTTAATTARLAVALPEYVKVTPAALVPAILTLGQRGLQEHRLLQDEDLAAVGIASVAALATSLHLNLNLGNGYLRRGDLDTARHHLDQGLAGAHPFRPTGTGG